MIPELVAVKTAQTTIELERAWQRFNRRVPFDNRYHRPRSQDARDEKQILEAIEQRGWRMVRRHPQGWRIPRIQRRGNSYRASLNRKEYRTGTWGNGAGFRWALEHMVLWVKEVSNFRTRDKASTVVEWVIYGMPHRALMRVVR